MTIFCFSRAGDAGGSAQSLKCDECSTALKDVTAAELHAHKVTPPPPLPPSTRQIHSSPVAVAGSDHTGQ